MIPDSFDHDGPDIFDRQYEFAMQAALPVVTLGALVAPAATPLHDRMERENRLVVDGSEVQATPWSTNIVPKLLSREELMQGLQKLANRLYHPEAFTERLLSFMQRVGARRDLEAGASWSAGSMRSIDRDGPVLLKKLIALGPKEAKMVYTIFGTVSKKPELFAFAKPWLFQYAQIRYMYDQGKLWEPVM